MKKSILQIPSFLSLTLLLLSLLSTSASAQNSLLVADQVEAWPSAGTIVPIGPDYNRISTYLYILNRDEFLKLFTGTEFSKEQREQLGLKRRNDKPDLLQMSIKVKHPGIDQGKPITVPLFMYDVTSDAGRKKFEQYEGRLFNNIRAKDLTTDIKGTIEVNALINNESAEFWRGVAEQSATFAKSAAALATTGPLALPSLTTSLNSLITGGIDKLSTISTEGKYREEQYEFEVTLSNRETSAEFDEVVTAARLYQVSWVGMNGNRKTNFFKAVTAGSSPRPMQFKTEVTGQRNPYVLIVETRARRKIDQTKPEFTAEYNDRIVRERDEDLQSGDYLMLKTYVENFGTANAARDDVEKFGRTLNSEAASYVSLVDAINYAYTFKMNVQEENARIAALPAGASEKQRYEDIRGRYQTVDALLGQLFTAPDVNKQLKQAGVVIDALARPLANSNTTSALELEKELKVLLNYRNILSLVTSDPSTIRKNLSYGRYTDLKKRYETSLYEKLLANLPQGVDERIQFYNRLIADHPYCDHCIRESNSRKAALEQSTLSSVRGNFELLKMNQLQTFNDCRKAIATTVQILAPSLDTLVTDDFDRQNIQEGLSDIKEALAVWKTNVRKDAEAASIEDIGVWEAGIKDSRRQMRAAYERLRVVLEEVDDLSCLEE